MQKNNCHCMDVKLAIAAVMGMNGDDSNKLSPNITTIVSKIYADGELYFHKKRRNICLK